MFIGKKYKYGMKHNSVKDIVKIHKLYLFFRIGFYISLIVWMCGMCFSMFSSTPVGIRIAVILITLGIYIFFTIGKGIVEDKWRK